METRIAYPEIYKELESLLVTSNAEQRKHWATTIIKHDIDLKEFAPLLKEEKKLLFVFCGFSRKLECLIRINYLKHFLFY